MSSSPAPAPLGVYSLSEKEQRVKLRKRQQIEQHWQCSIDQVLPAAIVPRLSTYRSGKAKIGQQTPKAEWWRWAGDLFYRLENLAAMTPGRLPFAQALMQAEVTQRQQDYTSRSRETAELLVLDLNKIIAELQERTKGGFGTDEEGYDDDSGDDVDDMDEGETAQEDGRGEVDGLEGSNGANGSDKSIEGHHIKNEDTANRPIKLESDEAPPVKRKATDAGNISATKRRSNGSSSHTQASKEALESRANIASLRAAATRLRQQASQREAKAYKLEAELYEKEAGEAE